MHTRTTLLVTLVTLLCASVAFAAPTKLSQQGRLLDGDGAPLTGTHGLLFRLHDAETGGNEVWQEERVVAFEDGYYSVVLGEQVPLSDLLFAAGPVWLELSVDGSVLSPRQEVVSVPYALRAAVAESVEGSTVDAEEVSIGGNVVIDSSGNWLGTPPDWSDLTGVPADLADGDNDSDTLLGLPCADGYVAKYSVSLGAWDCGEDNDSLAALSCQAGEGPVFEALSGLWVCGADLNTDTQLTEAEVDAFVANNNYSTGAHTVDTNTQLSESQVDTFVANNNYSTGSHTVNTDTLAALSCLGGEVARWDGSVLLWVCDTDIDTNTQLSESQVDTFVANNNYSTGPHTTDTNTQLSEAQVDTFVANNNYSTGAHTTNTDVLGGLSCAGGQIARYDSNTGLWTCGADAVLSEAQVESYITNGALALSGSLTVDTSTLVVNASTNHVGIGTPTPGSELHIKGEQLWSGNADVELESFDGNTRWTVSAQTDGKFSVYDKTNNAFPLRIEAGTATSGAIYVNSLGAVGIGTTTPGEKLTVTGTVESTSGGFKFPDGTTQASAASGGPGTIIYTRCAWSVNSYSQIGTCTPPACPTGWPDLGITGNVKTESTDYGYHNSAHPESAGYQERTCHSATTYLVAVTRCSWSAGSDSTIGSCTPPPCSSGWTDLGTTGNVKTAVMGYGYWNSNMTHSAGFQERTCTR